MSTSSKMTTSLVFLFALLLCLASNAFCVTYKDIIQQATGYKIAPRTFDGTLKTPGTPGVSNWHIAQWKNAYELGAFNNQYSVSNPSSRVVYTPSNNTLELALNGNLLGCGVAIQGHHNTLQ
ncbi:hypothetical protein C9374_010022 [Naegleria lovaniensis]|uniref:Uncharacterized protein n=1 Tax=Naegleria lovaniensis TaxID=51637 RepID=A0AA88GHL4_NAELO|nr:uncharacterized protein C9374_010022 [Naegleria lovaniensis]KAG2375399.1 hypothetical protein C9374_010022 [Naegleria lovaniensis]